MANETRQNFVPSMGYILPGWQLNNAYRATALAYMQRESVVLVQNSNGNWYGLAELKAATISSNY